LKAELAEKGADALFAELERVDPVSAGRIHRNDSYRLTRALEAFRAGGRPLSSYSWFGDESRQPRSGYDFQVLTIQRPRAEVWSRIEARCEAMFREGLADEVARLRSQGFGPNDPGMKAIGYREFWTGDSFRNDLAAVKAQIVLDTKHYAKRQETFLRSAFHRIPTTPVLTAEQARIPFCFRRSLS
jgi:tRNA dimethylallyltransferase